MIANPSHFESDKEFILRLDDPQELLHYLIRRGHAKHGEALTAARARRGSMNCVVRVARAETPIVFQPSTLLRGGALSGINPGE
jgi:hypothetical protein